MGPKTRKSSGSKMSEYLGPSKDLLVSDLPTLRSVLCLGQLIMERQGVEQMTVNDMAKEVYNRVVAQYYKANAKFVPPVILDDNWGVKKVVTAWNNVNTILRKQKGAQKLHQKMQLELDHLFDMVRCQCPIKCVGEDGITVDCKDDDCLRKTNHHQQMRCTCDKDLKIPMLDLGFIRAQRLKVGDRSTYQIGLNDKPESKKQQKNLDRKALDQAYEDVKDEKINQDKENKLNGQRVKEFLD